MSTNTTLAATALAPTARKPVAAPAGEQASGFGDLLDAVNPLQHVPVVSSLYREASGDGIGLPARLVGGFLFGGPWGLLGSAALAAFEGMTGDTPLGHLKSLTDTAAAGNTATTAAAPPVMPWMKPAGPTDAHPAAPPSTESMTAALQRVAAGTSLPAGQPAAQAAQPAPQLLAKLYELHATQPTDTRAGTRAGTL